MPLWTNRYEGPDGFDHPYAVAVDNGGNVFVTGGSGGSYLTIAYSGAGAPLWTNRYGATEAYALAVDRSGNVVVTGSAFVFVHGFNDEAMANYAAVDGSLLWENLCPGGGASAMALDSGGCDMCSCSAARW